MNYLKRSLLCITGIQCVSIRPVMETMNSEHRWIHPVASQHEGVQGSERIQSASCSAPGMGMMEPTQLLPPDEVDVFFHHLDGSGNAGNAWSYPGARGYRPSMCQMTPHGPTAFQDPQGQGAQPGSCSRVFLPTAARVQTGQVCRPHFHPPLQWIESKPTPGYPGCATTNPASVWCPTFQQGHRPSPVPSSATSSGAGGVHSSSHLFSFPPTPPKENTPEGSSAVPDGFFSYGSNDEKRFKSGIGMQFSTRPDLRIADSALAGYPSQAIQHYVGSEINMSSFAPLSGLPGIMANRNFTRTRTKSRSNSG